MIQNVLIYTHHKNHFDHWLRSFASYLSRQGHKVIHRSGTVSNFWFEYVVPRCHHVFIWNGNEDHYLLVKELCNRYHCLLYTSDAADDLLCVDLGGRRIIQKKKQDNHI